MLNPEGQETTELQPFAEKMNEFFRVAGNVALTEGIEGLANAVGGYATYHPDIPDDVKAAMLTFEGALRQRTIQEHQEL
jgi:hypothetical protein